MHHFCIFYYRCLAFSEKDLTSKSIRNYSDSSIVSKKVEISNLIDQYENKKIHNFCNFIA